MAGMIFAGLITVAAFMFLLMKLDIYKVLWFDIFLDILGSIALIFMFAGTFTGMFSAIVAGALFSVILYILKHTIGYKRLRFMPVYSRPWRSRFQWEHVKPDWQKG